MSLLDRVLSAGSIKMADVLNESAFFSERDLIPTELPILNIAFSGKLDGGVVPGLTILAGESKSFKTMLGLYCMKAYFDKYPDAIGLVYDSEFSITPDYLKTFGLDASRIIHIPIEHVEQLKFDMAKRLEQIERKDKVFILVDSLGNLASKKEVEDAAEEKSVADMSRAKAIRSWLRIVTPHFTMKDIPCFVINHVYKTMEMYSKDVIPGGTAVTYASNQIFVITKAQEKEGTELAGWKFTINIHKSRFVREKAKLPFTVMYEGGISKWSGLIDIALESGHVIKPKNGWYAWANLDTGEVAEKNVRLADTNNKAFWEKIIHQTSFKDYIYNRYNIGSSSLIQFDEDEEETLLDDEDETTFNIGE